tara:strand:+ start:933 stop:1778 length:846 start_codon:yes stop_codon:yes gene_type:complete
MKFYTFYSIYYRHRIKKAKLILKTYIFIILPFSYLLNLFFLPKITNLDEIDYNKFENKTLDYLLEYFGSDKAKKVFDQYPKPIQRKKIKIKGHGYSKFYEKYFNEFKNLECNILELGSFNGNALAAFYFFLKKSNIYSGDIHPDILRYKSKRIRNFFIDCGSENSIKKNIVNQDIYYDIIIEDAAHNLKHQIITLFMCFEKLKSRGIYVVEELDFPDTREDMIENSQGPTLKAILEKIKSNQEFESKYVSKEDKNYFLKHFSSIEIFVGDKGNEIAFIRKK